MAQYLLSAHTVEGQAREPMTDEEMKNVVTRVHALEDEMKAAGAWVFGGRLQQPDSAIVVRVSDGEALTTDGPFAETKELLAGFWMIQVASRAEALEWASRVPFTDGEVVEVRQVFETSDFPADVLPPEDAAREDALRAELAKKAKR